MARPATHSASLQDPVDATIEQYLHAPDAWNAMEKELRPLCQRVARRYANPDRVEDTVQEALLALAAVIDAVRQGKRPPPDAGWTAYALVVARNHALRSLDSVPSARRRLRDHTLALLDGRTRVQGLTRWERGGLTLAGYSLWTGRAVGKLAALGPIEHDPNRLRLAVSLDRPTAQLATDALARLLDAIFRQVGEPVPLDRLLALLWDLWPETQPAASWEETPEPVAPDHDDPAVRHELLLALAQILRGLLSQPPHVIAAYLLGLEMDEAHALLAATDDPDGAGRQIARMLGISEEELTALLERVPLPDREIHQRFARPKDGVAYLRFALKRKLRALLLKEDC